MARLRLCKVTDFLCVKIKAARFSRKFLGFWLVRHAFGDGVRQSQHSASGVIFCMEAIRRASSSLMMPGVKNLAKHWMNRSVSFFGWFLSGVELFIGICWDFLCSMNGWRVLLLCSTAWGYCFFHLFLTFQAGHSVVNAWPGKCGVRLPSSSDLKWHTSCGLTKC